MMFSIVAFSTLQPYTYDYYYGNPYIVFADVRSEIRPIIRKIEALLVALTMKPKILKVLIMTHDLDIWITSLKQIIEYYAKDWQKYEEQKQTYLYHNFCFKFMEILTEWDRAGFAPENISGYINTLTAWIKDNNVSEVENNGANEDE